MKNEGFIFFETVAAIIIIFSIVFMFVPAIIMIETEKHVLLDRRQISNLLHDELQIKLIDRPNYQAQIYHVKHNNLEITYQFESEQGLFKGCATWENIKKKNEDICFYGI